MNLENLRNLKNNIEEKRNLKLETENKYYPLSLENGYINDLVEYGIEEKNLKSMDEIIDSENTDEVVKQCDDAIKIILSILSETGIPYDQIQLNSGTRFYCKVNFVKEIKEFYAHHSYDKFDELEYQILMNELPNQSIIPFIPVELYFDGNNTGTLDESIYQSNYKWPILKYETLHKIKVKGIINIKEFIRKMSDLGYDVNISSFNDCVEESKHNGTFNIIVDFGRKEKINSKKR